VTQSARLRVDRSLHRSVWHLAVCEYARCVIMTGATGTIGATGSTGQKHQVIKRAAAETTTESPCVGPEGRQLRNTLHVKYNARYATHVFQQAIETDRF